jgi:hypothetical protein
MNIQLEIFKTENSIKLVQQFRICAAYTDEIEWELSSMEKFYNAKLHKLKQGK